MKNADVAFVYYSPHTIEHKRLAPITPEEVKAAFNSENVQIFTDSKEMVKALEKESWHNHNLLMMSSGNFDGIDFMELGEELLK